MSSEQKEASKLLEIAEEEAEKNMLQEAPTNFSRRGKLPREKAMDS